MRSAGKPMEILARINKMAAFGPDEEIELYEVVYPECGYYVLDASGFKINFICTTSHICVLFTGNKI